jgi:hypothetical protein
MLWALGTIDSAGPTRAEGREAQQPLHGWTTRAEGGRGGGGGPPPLDGEGTKEGHPPPLDRWRGQLEEGGNEWHTPQLEGC